MRVVTVAEWVADEFEESRPRLRAIAYRMLGSTAEADDAVQEAWLRLSRTGPESIDNLGGWLATVVSRVCLDVLRSRRSRREEPAGASLPEPVPAEDVPAPGEGDPEHGVLVADSIGPALMLVLDSLDPDERLAFVLHDLFGVPFGEIAPIVGRSARIRTRHELPVERVRITRRQAIHATSGRLRDEHVAGALMGNGVGNGPNHTPDAMHTFAADDDEVGTDLLGNADHDIGRVACARMGLHLGPTYRLRNLGEKLLTGLGTDPLVRNRCSTGYLCAYATGRHVVGVHDMEHGAVALGEISGQRNGQFGCLGAVGPDDDVREHGYPLWWNSERPPPVVETPCDASPASAPDRLRLCGPREPCAI